MGGTSSCWLRSRPPWLPVATALGTVPEAPRSDGGFFLVFAYIWQEDVAKKNQVPGAPASLNVNPARAITWLIGVTI